MTNKPTPKEIDDLVYELRQAGKDDTYSLASAVLAKWGQPAQAVVGGKPVYQASYKGGFWQDSSRERHEYLKTPEGSSATDWELRVLYTAPQPVAREPLTDEQTKALMQAHRTAMLMTCKARVPECGEFAAIAQDLDWLCESFGIKGGQHGTE